MAQESQQGPYIHNVHLSDAALKKLENNTSIISITLDEQKGDHSNSTLFLARSGHNWSTHNYGPIYIPEEGKTVAITAATIPFYKRIIEVYEGSEMGIKNDIQVNGNSVTLNGNPITEYTFKQDYYWMMGDNRQNSIDSRYWGFVPFDHVVGKPVLVWMSFDTIKKKIRWDRLFTTVHGTGEKTSYLIPVLVLIA